MTILLYFLKKKLIFNFLFDNFFFTNFIGKFLWQVFFKNVFFEKCHFDGNACGELKIFQKFQKKLLLCLRKIVPHVSWNSSGLFSKKEVFWHIDFIVSSMHPDALLFGPPSAHSALPNLWKLLDRYFCKENKGKKNNFLFSATATEY